MADILLRNISNLNGEYDGASLDVTSNEIETTIVTGLSAVKTANLTVWHSGELTYTITITNEADHDYETPTFTDTLDTTLINLVTDSVYVNDVITPYTYNAGVLSITLPTIAIGQTVVIRFNVSLV